MSYYRMRYEQIDICHLCVEVSHCLCVPFIINKNHLLLQIPTSVETVVDLCIHLNSGLDSHGGRVKNQ